MLLTTTGAEVLVTPTRYYLLEEEPVLMNLFLSVLCICRTCPLGASRLCEYSWNGVIKWLLLR